jgi:hypothetical protein
MIPVDATTLRALAPAESGKRADRQSQIIAGIGATLAATLARYAIDMSRTVSAPPRNMPMGAPMRGGAISAMSSLATGRVTRAVG